MASLNLDNLMEAGTSADIDKIMSEIRAQVQSEATSPPGPTPIQAPTAELAPPMATGDALKAQAEFNHDLMSTLRMLGAEVSALRADLAQVREQQRAATELDQAVQESLARGQSDWTRAEQGLAELRRVVTAEQEESRRQQYEQIRIAAQRAERVRELQVVLDATGKRIDFVAGRTHDAEQSLEQLHGRVEGEVLMRADLSARIATLDHKLDTLAVHRTKDQGQIDDRFDALTMRLLRAERVARNKAALNAPSANAEANDKAAESTAGNSQLPFDYFMFALKYRGSPTSVRARQAAYVDLFRGRGHVLDLGCGRGEFLELVSANGIRATGVDADQDMVEFSRERGLNVVHADLFEYLKELQPSSLDGIFAAQVIEHLPPEQVRLLINLCSQRLGTGGLLVLETVNPLCPSALSNFWMDPTHIRPVPPKLLTFLLEEAGFLLQALRFESPVEQSAAAPRMETLEWPAEIDQYQDYAAIARLR
ncbi:MAG: methyltransferase domain-containing protein [Chloroflexi bacterium]|nr:methyltransferase domain-containing protein [Chloroflexota bacterium]